MASANLRWTADVGDAIAKTEALKAVTASVGDSAAKTGKKMKTAWRDSETGLLNFDRAAKQVSKSLSGGPFGLFGAIGNVVKGALNLGGVAQQATAELGQMASAGGSAGGIMGTLGTTLGGLAPVIGSVTAGAGLLAAALLVLPALFTAVTFVAVALLDVITTLSAVVAGFVAPLTLVVGLLGGLGAAFAYVAAQSFKNKSSLQQQHDALLKVHVAQQTYNADLAKYGAAATQTESALIALHTAQDALEKSQQGVALGALNLSDKFHSLVRTLSKDFAPEILKLGQAAATALHYLGQIAKLPLDQAFKNLATRGVALFSQFLYGIGNVLKKPFRLAIAIAFGKSGSTMQKSVQSWWDSFTGYLLGYTKTKQIELRPGKFGFSTQTIKGALDPLTTWFGQQNFTATGLKWSQEIFDGLTGKKGGSAGNKLGKFFATIAGDAAHKAGQVFVRVFEYELKALGGWIAGFFKKNWQAIIIFAGNPIHAVGNLLHTVIFGALGAIWGKIKSIGGAFAGWIGNILSSIPGLQTVLGMLSRIASIVGGGAGPLFSGKSTQGGPRGAHHALGGIVTRQVTIGNDTYGEPSTGGEAILPLGSPGGREALAAAFATAIHKVGGGGPTIVQNFYGLDDATLKIAARKMQPYLAGFATRRA